MLKLFAADGASGSSQPLEHVSNNLNAQNLTSLGAVTQIYNNINHLSSNGYYGFAYANAAHEVEINNNNNNDNNNTTSNLMANDINGTMNNTSSTTNIQQSHESSVNFDSSADVAGNTNVARCKKRFYVMIDNNDGVPDNVATNNKNYSSDNYEVAAKRCRLDDDSSVQYCSDIFQLPSTQIGTQSCIMDIEECQQPLQQQQQVDVPMFENTDNNLEKMEQNIDLRTCFAENQYNKSQEELKMRQQQQQEAQQTQLYHQQQHYQGIQCAAIKCHLNNNCDTLASNTHACTINLDKNTKKVLRTCNSYSIQTENIDNDVANDSNVDDDTLYAHLHGGCLHLHVYFSRNKFLGKGNYFATNDAINNNSQDDDDFEEF